MLTKTTKITVKDYNIVLKSPLKFYKEDSLMLYFELEEYGLVVEKNGRMSYATTQLFPESAFLYVETPKNVDTIEAAHIEGNRVCFQLTALYTINIGISRMQIVLLDGGSRKALPPFEFEVQPVIYTEKPPITYDGLMDEYGVALCSEDMMLLESTDEVYGIRISELPMTDDILGYIPIVQDGVTKQVYTQNIVDVAKTNTMASVETYVESYVQDALENFSNEEEILNIVDEKIDESLTYQNPASTTIVDFKSALDYLLYYDLTINFTTTSATTFEVGTVLKDIIFMWNYNKGVTYQSFNGMELPIGTNAYVYPDEFSTTKTFTLSAKDERQTFSKSITFNFRHGRYWGVSSSTALNSSGIMALSKELSTSRAKTFTVNAGVGEYIYYCYPSSWGNATFSVGGFVGGFELVGTVNFTNINGVTTQYYVYKSANASLGNTTVTVS